ncbi:MAG: hypothetical protein HY951_03325 [Bacteroidia bacterium]|nr:hypothetical protein [Bacteroidia bacterium]
MSTNLDTYFSETTERYFNRLVNIYKKRMAKANDKDYAHNEFTNYCGAILEIRYKASEREVIVNALEHEYKIGKEFALVIKVLRKEIHKQILNDTIDFIEITQDTKTPAFDETIPKKKPETYFIDQYSDLELVRMFSEYKAYEKFSEFLKSEKLNKEIEKRLKKEKFLPEKETEEKYKDYTTARQVLAVHYLLQYYNVKNVDKTEIARFIQFLTGKNLDNIYKKIQNPFKVNDKSVKDDLRFVREYFEKMGMAEVVKMINSELNS